MSQHTGGPAFPTVDNWKVDSGMTLRDYFAAKAMQQFMLQEKPPTYEAGFGITYRREFVATQAYAMADAMMKAREA